MSSLVFGLILASVWSYFSKSMRKSRTTAHAPSGISHPTHAFHFFTIRSMAAEKKKKKVLQLLDSDSYCRILQSRRSPFFGFLRDLHTLARWHTAQCASHVISASACCARAYALSFLLPAFFIKSFCLIN